MWKITPTAAQHSFALVFSYCAINGLSFPVSAG